MKTKVDDLFGPALTWAAIVAEGQEPMWNGTGIGYYCDEPSRVFPHSPEVYPDYDDRKAGELIVSHWIGVERPLAGQTPPSWRAIGDVSQTVREQARKRASFVHVVEARHPKFAVAVTRCFIKMKLGDAVDIPQDILDQCDDEAKASHGNDK